MQYFSNALSASQSPEALSLLLTDPVLNQKLLSLLSRSTHASSTTPFSLWFEENAIACIYGSQPMFIFIKAPPSKAFEAILSGQYLQGSISSFRFLAISSCDIVKTTQLMVCDASCFAPTPLPDNITVASAQGTEREAEIDRLLAEFEESVGQLSGGDPTTAKSLISRGELFVAIIDDELAGCAFLSHPERGVCRLSYVYTREKFRGRGVGKATITRALEGAIRERKLSCTLFVNAKNEPAKKLYQTIGFRKVTDYEFRKDVRFGT